MAINKNIFIWGTTSTYLLHINLVAPLLQPIAIQVLSFVLKDGTSFLPPFFLIVRNLVRETESKYSVPEGGFSRIIEFQ